MAQLALDLQFRPALGRGDFVVSDSNRDAIAWLDRWPDWPSTVLAIHGPAGCGKTHLAHVWQTRSRAVFVAQIDAADLTPNAAVILDGLDSSGHGAPVLDPAQAEPGSAGALASDTAGSGIAPGRRPSDRGGATG